MFCSSLIAPAISSAAKAEATVAARKADGDANEACGAPG
jgi:hypothetical protein